MSIKSQVDQISAFGAESSVCVCTGVYSSQAKINKLEMRHSHKNNTAINLRRPEKACASITGNSNNINDNSTHEKKN